MKWLIVLGLALASSVAAAAPLPIAISVSPAADCIIAGPQGGPFAPPQCSYTIAANRSWTTYSISGVPAWLRVSVSSNRTPATVTLSLDQAWAARAPAGDYAVAIRFANDVGGYGTTTRAIRLAVRPPPASWALSSDAAPRFFAAAGDTVTFQYVVTNTSQVSIGAIAVTSSVNGAVPCPYPALAPGQRFLCSATYQTSAADIARGSIVDTAEAAAIPPDQAPALASVTVTYQPPATTTNYLLCPDAPEICLTDGGDRVTAQ